MDQNSSVCLRTVAQKDPRRKELGCEAPRCFALPGHSCYEEPFVRQSGCLTFAYQLYTERGFEPWTTFNNGAYRQFLRKL